MTQYEFIHEKLFPLLTLDTQKQIYNYTSSRLYKESCISSLINRKNKIQMEIDGIEKAIELLRNIIN